MKRSLDLANSLNKIRNFFYHNDRIPSLGETATIFNYSSRNTALYLLNKLTDCGYMKKGPKGKYITTPKFHQRTKVLGSVSAGFPTPEEEEFSDSVLLDDFLVSNPSNTFMLEVNGDSMIEAGIMDNDYVLVEKGRAPKIGDIVVAEVDGDWTMKYYRKDKKGIYLEPANPAYPNIYPEQELTIGGVVISSLRRYVYSKH